jgi:hypothetical protein
MKNLFLILPLVFILSSCANRLTSLQEEEIMEAGLPKIDPAVLEIQIRAEKEHRVFVSEKSSTTIFRRYQYHIPLVYRPGLPLLYKYTILNPDKVEAIQWSRAIAKNRFNDNDRLDLAYALIKASITKGDFKKTMDLLDCKTGKIIGKSEANDFIYFGLYSTIATEDTQWGAGRETPEEKNHKIDGFYLKLNELAKAKDQTSYRVILLATTSDSRKIQSCEITRHL